MDDERQSRVRSRLEATKNALSPERKHWSFLTLVASGLTMVSNVFCRFSTPIGVAIVALTITGCGGPPPALVSSPTVTAIQSSELPIPLANDSKSNAQAYRIGAFDKLLISVYGLQELTLKEIQTDVSGRISVPLAGSVQAGGLTPAELEGEIAARLKAAYVRDPKVTVNLMQASSENVTVDGQVQKPGVYPVLARMTLMQAVASASGITEDAKLDDVVVFRTVEGKRYAALYNMKAIRRGAYEDPQIYPQDIVIVGESSARRMFRDFIQLVPLLTTPIIVSLQN